MFDVTAVPIGNLDGTSKSTAPDPKAKRTVEVDIPSEEKDIFDIWLRKLWEEKDNSMDKFFDSQSLAPQEAAFVDIPLKLRRKREILDAFCFFWPASFAYLWGRLRG